MKKLLELLKDGNSRTIELLAAELETTPEDVRRKIDFLERMGVIQRSGFSVSARCGGNCGGCESAAACKGCIPKNAPQNMGDMWEVKK